MQLFKRFVAGIVVGAALVGLALWAMPPATESVANPPLAPSPFDLQPYAGPPHPALQVISGPNVSVPVAPTAPPFVPPERAQPLPQPEVGPPLVKPVEKQEEKPKLPPGRTAIRVNGPAGMKVSWLIGASFHDRDLAAPASYNFVQGQVYRLRLTGMTKYPASKFYPTLDVAAPGERAVAFLAHNAIPLTFTDTELAAAAEGRLIVKAVYLPTTSDGQPSAPDEVSTVRLGANADAVAVASGRGTLLAVVRLGNVDLENPDSPALNAPATADAPVPVRMPPAAVPSR